MNEQAPGHTGALTNRDIIDLTKRPSDAYNEVILQADYTTRASLSFYRFRQLGGDYRVRNEKYADHKKRRAEKKKDGAPQTPESIREDSAELAPKRTRKLRLGESTGRGVHYVSSHPKVPLLQMSIIALMILFESAANAYFFAKQSEFGLAGGVFQAAAVSLANVAVSFFIIGYWGLRHTSMPLDRENFFGRRNLYFANGVAAIIIGVILVLLVNLSAAHYRNILDIQALGLQMPEGIGTKIFPHFMVNPDVCQAILTSDLGDTIGSAATNAMCRPFAIHSLDAMVLLALGLAIASIAAFEGRRLDSPFPGFSDAARSLENARSDLEDAIEDFNESYEDVFELVESIKGSSLSPNEKMTVMNTMAEMMLPYQNLLRTSDQILSDEFGLEQDIINLLKVKPAGAN
ncbi:MAG: hypothetical protein VXW22_09360 [Pseudomonadota bacterium]|jgi:hypothetical protein|nr:hypothetical protein [Pseudomonadota bacterium]